MLSAECYFLGLFSTTTKSLLQCSHFAVAKRMVLPGQRRGVRFWQCGHSNSCLSNPGVIFGAINFDESGIDISREALVCRYARVHRRVRQDGHRARPNGCSRTRPQSRKISWATVVTDNQDSAAALERCRKGALPSVGEHYDSAQVRISLAALTLALATAMVLE